MSKDKKIFNNVDLRDNSIKNAKTATKIIKPISGSEELLEGNLASDLYVTEKTTYRTSIEDVNNPGTGKQTSSVTVGGISAGDVVEGNTISQLFDRIFHPRIPAVYNLPTLTATITAKPTNEVGSMANTVISTSVNLRDSSGADGAEPYTFSGGSLNGSFSNSTGSITDNSYVTKEGSNAWTVDFKYLGANVKKDSHGNDDPVGQFGDGTISKTASYTGFWPWFIYNGNNIAPPTSLATVRNLFVKNVAAVPSSSFTATVVGDTAVKSVVIVVPDDNNTATISVIKDGALPITASFIKSRIVNAPDLTNSGYTKSYSVFYHTTGSTGYSADSTYTISINI